MISFLVDLVKGQNFNIVDGFAWGITLATLMKLLPLISAVLSIVWLCLRIYIALRDEIFNKKKE